LRLFEISGADAPQEFVTAAFPALACVALTGCVVICKAGTITASNLGYLASPAVVAASAMLGYMGPPSELGIEWKAERFV